MGAGKQNSQFIIQRSNYYKITFANLSEFRKEENIKFTFLSPTTDRDLETDFGKNSHPLPTFTSFPRIPFAGSRNV